MYSVGLPPSKVHPGGAAVRLPDRRYNGVSPKHSVPMIIEGPIRVSAESSEDGSGFGLHLSFAKEFQALEKARQAADFAAYLEPLAGFPADLSSRLN